MIVKKASFEIENEPNWDDVLVNLERAIRTCYKSEKKITPSSADKLIRSIISRGHESTLEHQSMTVRFIADRGFLAELTRHRHCSFSVESTRYVNYSPEGNNNDGDMMFILPCWMDDKFLGNWDDDKLDVICDGLFDGDYSKCSPDYKWIHSMINSQKSYCELISGGWNAEHARSVLPNSLKTEIVVTTNIRDWRHIFGLRCDKTAHPQMRELMVPLQKHLAEVCPTLFDSIEYEYEDWTTIQKRTTKVKK